MPCGSSVLKARVSGRLLDLFVEFLVYIFPSVKIIKLMKYYPGRVNIQSFIIDGFFVGVQNESCYKPIIMLTGSRVACLTVN